MVVARRFSAGRYGRAIFELALEKEELDRWQSDLEKVMSLGQDATIAAYLENPKVHLDDKIRLLSRRLGDIDPLVLNLLYLLLARGRLNMLPDVAHAYQRLLDSYHGIERAEVTTAVPLDDEARLKLSQHLSDIIGKEVLLEPEVDPGLIGGVVVRVAGKLLDGSTQGKLAALRREITRV